LSGLPNIDRRLIRDDYIADTTYLLRRSVALLGKLPVEHGLFGQTGAATPKAGSTSAKRSLRPATGTSVQVRSLAFRHGNVDFKILESACSIPGVITKYSGCVVALRRFVSQRQAGGWHFGLFGGLVYWMPILGCDRPCTAAGIAAAFTGRKSVGLPNSFATFLVEHIPAIVCRSCSNAQKDLENPCFLIFSRKLASCLGLGRV
jgi:hypothetical protein